MVARRRLHGVAHPTRCLHSAASHGDRWQCAHGRCGGVALIGVRLPFGYTVAAYLDACSSLGVRQFDLFQTVELYEGKNMRAVVMNVHALGRVAQVRPTSNPNASEAKSMSTV